MKYTPPTAEQLRQLKESTSSTAKKMAEHTCVTEQHWRKYTASTVPRGIPYEKLFHFAALKVLSEDQVNAIHQRMVHIGAVIEAEELNDPDLLGLRLRAQDAADKHKAITDRQVNILRNFPGSTPPSPEAAANLDDLIQQEKVARANFMALEEAYIKAGGMHPFFVNSSDR